MKKKLDLKTIKPIPLVLVCSVIFLNYTVGISKEITYATLSIAVVLMGILIFKSQKKKPMIIQSIIGIAITMIIALYFFYY